MFHTMVRVMLICPDLGATKKWQKKDLCLICAPIAHTQVVVYSLHVARVPLARGTVRVTVQFQIQLATIRVRQDVKVRG